MALQIAMRASAANGGCAAFQWVAKPMRARIDLADKHALLDALDERGQ